MEDGRGVRRDQERSGETKGGNADSEWRLSGNEKDWKSNERMRNKRNKRNKRNRRERSRWCR